jgi:nicotinamidase-related amidase
MFVPEIEQVLFENPERTQIILLGLEAHVCVLQTCYDLLEKGFDVWILADGVSSISSFERSIGLKGL